MKSGAYTAKVAASDGKELAIETPVFKSTGVFSYTNDSLNKNSIRVDRDACPWLVETVTRLQDILYPKLVEQAYSQMDAGLFDGNALPPQLLSLFQSDDERNSNLGQKYDARGAWFRLASSCMMFNVETGKTMSKLPKLGWYRLRIIPVGFFIDMESQKGPMIWLTYWVDQLAFQPIKQELTLSLDDFPGASTLTTTPNKSTSADTITLMDEEPEPVPMTLMAKKVKKTANKKRKSPNAM